MKLFCENFAGGLKPNASAVDKTAKPMPKSLFSADLSGFSSNN